MAKLDRNRESREALPCRDECFGVRAGWDEPAGKLKQDDPELAGRVQRGQRLAEQAPHFVEDLIGQILRVDACLVRLLAGQRFTQSLGKTPRLGWVVGH